MGEAKKGGRRKCREGQQAFTEIFKDLTAGKTQQEIANLVGVTRQNVGRWRDGSVIPDATALVKLADVFETSVDYLLGRTKVKSIEPSLQAACGFTKLSELALDNARRARHASLLLESSDFAELVERLHKVKVAIPNSVGAKAARQDAVETFDKILGALNNKATGSAVTVTCYGKTQHYSNKDEAIRFFSEAARHSDGSELERYSRILCQLREGRLDCNDDE